MELYQLKYFVYAAKYENISMAAQELHVTQPSISKAIRALEKELQIVLMRKSGKYCVLTHEGRLFQARLTPLLNELYELPEEIRNGEMRTLTRLNALSADPLIPELIRLFREKNPDVFFKVMEKREGISWDLCIRSTLPQVFFNNARKLMDEKIFLAFHKDSWLREKEVVSLEDIRNENFIMLKEGGSLRMIAGQKFREYDFIPNIAFECDNVYILKRMIQEGLGITVWPQFSWREGLKAELYRDVCLRPLDIPNFYRSLYLIYQKDMKMTPALEAFSKFTVEYFGGIEG